MYSFSVHSYAGIKNRDEGKNGQESNNEIEEVLLKSLTDCEIELKFGWDWKLQGNNTCSSKESSIGCQLDELSGSGFESSCSHLNFTFCGCFEQGVPWHPGNYRV